MSDVVPDWWATGCMIFGGIAGLLCGFAGAGIGGAIVGAVVGVIAGAVLGVAMVYVLGFCAIAGAIWLIVKIISSLWGVGKP